VLPTALAERETWDVDRIIATAVLPARDGDPLPPSPLIPAPTADADEILRCAETLGIPWKRILLSEVEAERRLRRYLPRIDEGLALSPAATVLSSGLLRSWRLRDRIEGLAAHARGDAGGAAARQVRMIFRRLLGKEEADQKAFAQHLWSAYQRVLHLQRAWRAASRSRGTTAERLAFTCAGTRCSYDDAAWALCRQDLVPRRGRRLEAAVQKVREEGFWIPRAQTEARAFDQLRRIVRSSPHLRAARPGRRRPRPSVSQPRRVSLPVAL